MPRKLPNASIEVLGSSQSTTTDADGNFEIKPLALGRYDIRFSAALYSDKVILNITISIGVTSTLNAELDPLP